MPVFDTWKLLLLLLFQDYIAYTILRLALFLFKCSKVSISPSYYEVKQIKEF